MLPSFRKPSVIPGFGLTLGLTLSWLGLLVLLPLAALVVKTTNARLARGIGEALEHAYRGELDYRFTEAENVLRVGWKR